jgi:hypothetical protein
MNDLALLIYKKLKFDYKIKECVMDLLLEKKTEKMNTLKDVIEYYKNLGMSEKVHRYTQMAYEQMDDIF